MRWRRWCGRLRIGEVGEVRRRRVDPAKLGPEPVEVFAEDGVLAFEPGVVPAQRT